MVWGENVSSPKEQSLMRQAMCTAWTAIGAVVSFFSSQNSHTAHYGNHQFELTYNHTTDVRYTQFFELPCTRFIITLINQQGNPSKKLSILPQAHQDPVGWGMGSQCHPQQPITPLLPTPDQEMTLLCSGAPWCSLPRAFPNYRAIPWLIILALLIPCFSTPEQQVCCRRITSCHPVDRKLKCSLFPGVIYTQPGWWMQLFPDHDLQTKWSISPNP